MHDIVLFLGKELPKGLYIAKVIFFYIGNIKNPSTKLQDFFLISNHSIHGYKIKGYSLSGQFPEIIHYKCFHTARIISQPYLQDFHFSPSKRFISLSYLETSRVNSFFIISHLSFYCIAQRSDQCRRMRSACLFPESWPYCKGAVPVPESGIQKGR